MKRSQQRSQLEAVIAQRQVKLKRDVALLAAASFQQPECRIAPVIPFGIHHNHEPLILQQLLQPVLQLASVGKRRRFSCDEFTQMVERISISPPMSRERRELDSFSPLGDGDFSLAPSVAIATCRGVTQPPSLHPPGMTSWMHQQQQLAELARDEGWSPPPPPRGEIREIRRPSTPTAKEIGSLLPRFKRLTHNDPPLMQTASSLVTSHHRLAI